MATTIIQAFSEFLTNTINLDPEETKTAKGSRDWLMEQMKSFSGDDQFFPETYTEKNIFYGSFARKTKKRPLDDIDIMLCVKASNCTYLEYSDRIEITAPDSATRFRNYLNEGTNIVNSRKVINDLINKLGKIPQYKKAEIKRNLEAATLNLQTYDWIFDIVPCFFTTEDDLKRTYYIIPDGKGNWKKTDPRLDRDRLARINSNHDGNVLNVIRIIKYWNNRATMPTMGSYLLENMILDYYEEKSNKASAFVDLEIIDVLFSIHSKVYNPVHDPKKIQGDLNSLSYEEKRRISDKAYEDYTKAFAARRHETNTEMKESIKKWSEIFGDKFPSYG